MLAFMNLGLEDFQGSENDDEEPINIIDDSIVTKL